MSTGDEVQIRNAMTILGQPNDASSIYFAGGATTLSVGSFITAGPIIIGTASGTMDGIVLQGQGRHGTCIQPGASFTARAGSVTAVGSTSGSYTVTSGSALFASTDVGRTIRNVTDETYTTIAYYNSGSQVACSGSVFAVGETWKIEDGIILGINEPNYCKISDLFIYGRHSYTTGPGIYGQFRRGLFQNLLIGECGGHGIFLGGGSGGGVKVAHCYIYSNEGHGIYLQSSAGGDSWVTDVGVNGNRQDGIAVETSGCIISHIHAAGQFGHGISLGPIDELYRTTVHNVYFDSNHVNSLDISGHSVNGLSVNGCLFWNGGDHYGGSWVDSTNYSIGASVVNGGTYFVANAAGSAHEPPNTSYWDALEGPPTNIFILPHSGALKNASFVGNHFESGGSILYNIDFAGAATTHANVTFMGNNFLSDTMPSSGSHVHITNMGVGTQVPVFMGNVPKTTYDYTSGRPFAYSISCYSATPAAVQRESDYTFIGTATTDRTTLVAAITTVEGL